ncbi:hypothetical protein M406DRAFT_74673 [Cryphonectria parasitica EP155]|uniref:Uncharacterized protein n=1 Tax=Cryphonectria parasitica (strain ATCC 38755 / EP155) TaxID=660469 RepID=A0A9P5CL76_CRYP1|nr:uncharacterized protein M406DRAFT_74673 [Cryphonectria parasitica EP155]KAF3761736.1 hypothetical protein M406DRAFT_74673 [Cryphonectria parasitica EP155]
MHSSLARVAGLVLLGFGSFLLGVEGAPPRVLPARARAKTYTPVAVPNPFDSTHGYKNSKQWIPDRKYGNVYKITTPHYTGTLDLIAINPKDKSITVKDANNDDDKTPAAEKLSLAAIMMGLFVEEGKMKPKDLSIVRFGETVVEPTTIKAINEVYTSLGKVKGDDTTITITSTATDAKEKEAFTELLDHTKFGSNVQKLNGLYSTGKTVESFTLSGEGPQLEFHLG